MIKGLFAHDHKIFTYNNFYYSRGGLSAQVLSRYGNIFDELVVMTRQVKIEQMSEGLTLSNIPNASFVGISKVNSISGILNIGEQKRTVEKYVLESDYIIARLPSTIGILAIDAAIKFEKPYLIEVVADTWDSHWYHSLKGKIVAPLITNEVKKRVKNAKYVVYVTQEYLQMRNPTDGVSMGISDVSIPDLDEKILQKRLLKIENQDHKLILGTMGTLDAKYKGHEHIFKLLKYMKNTGSTNYEYQLVGGGDSSYLNTLAEKYDISSQVKIIGTLPHEDVYDWLDSIDLYIQPSKTEGLPRSVVEAMSRALPIFGTDVGGIPELIDNEYLFSKEFNMNRMTGVLRSFDNATMKEQAIKNFERATNYEQKNLNNKRDNFYKEFIDNFK